MSFSKPQVTFFSNFASPFSVMKDNCTFLGQTLNTLHNRSQWKWKFLRLPSARVKIHQVLVIFETTDQFFFKICINVQGNETQLLCMFLAKHFIYFQQKESIKVHIWWKFIWAVKSLKFCTLMGTFCPNHAQFQLKNYRRVISHDTEEWCKV